LILVVVALLIPITLQREKVWSTGLALWQDTLERNPSSMPARINLPEVLLQAGRVEEAKRQSEATLQTSYKTNPWVWVDYAIELNRLGAHAGAEQAARRAIELQPDIIDADKMVQTLQCPRNIALEFGRITASLPKQKQ
jgi:tetratricopeptide (TPR) repeat protein